jgi:hypothetical protein
MVVDAASHDDLPGWGCPTLLPWRKPLPGAALELQQHQQARKLWGGVVGQGAQQQLIDVVHMDSVEKRRQTKQTEQDGHRVSTVVSVVERLG